MTTQQPGALWLADELEAEFAQGRISNHTGRKAATELRRQHTRIAELEAQLESIGAGGVSGPLMGRAPLATNAGSEPVAWRIDWPDESELGHYFSEAPTDSGRCQPLYTHPSPPGGMAGWKWVPVEPTEEMLAAAHDGDREYTLRNFGDVMTVMQGPYDHWAAMIDAAPTPPAQTADSVLEDAARLDWLESNSQINIERVRYLGATKSIYEVTPYDSISYDGETLRAAIDAARAAQKGGE